MTKVNKMYISKPVLKDYKKDGVRKAKLKFPQIILFNEGDKGIVETSINITLNLQSKRLKWNAKKKFNVKAHKQNLYENPITINIDNYESIKKKLGRDPKADEFQYYIELIEKGDKCTQCEGTGRIKEEEHLLFQPEKQLKKSKKKIKKQKRKKNRIESAKQKIKNKFHRKKRKKKKKQR